MKGNGLFRRLGQKITLMIIIILLAIFFKVQRARDITFLLFVQKMTYMRHLSKMKKWVLCFLVSMLLTGRKVSFIIGEFSIK